VTPLGELLKGIVKMIQNEMAPTMVSNLYTLATHHTDDAANAASYSTVGQVQVNTEQAILPLENEKGTQLDVAV